MPICSTTSSTADAQLVQRQAFAGMIWSKQFFYFDVPAVARRAIRRSPPPPAEREHGRNREWMHLNNADIISMPDKWEYPWYAAWDLAFHMHRARADRFGVRQGAAGAAHARVVHASERADAGLRVGVRRCESAGARVGDLARLSDRPQTQRGGKGDLAFLERVFHKLMLNFTWWVNRKDAEGRNVFQGGFLGLDNIGVFDRSAPLPTGGHIDQADGTSWMAMYCLNLHAHRARAGAAQPRLRGHRHEVLRALPAHRRGHEQRRARRASGSGTKQDEFFYDVLHLPDGGMVPLKVRSMVGSDSAVRGRNAGAGTARQGCRSSSAGWNGS